MKSKEVAFLLGGYDLEMVTIKHLFEKNKVLYYDKQLMWSNAQLSAYEGVLSSNINEVEAIYGIELQTDIIPPDNYFSIDHHSKFEGRDSSLEQVANLLQLKLNRYLTLVAANDKGYIPAMLELGASSMEIEQIRRKDRKIQGVTEADEIAAQKAVESRRIMNNLILIKSDSPRFSPICDRVYPCQNLLIYTTSEWMYYGEKKNKVVALFSNDVEEGRVFYGGGETGYVGTVNNRYTERELNTMINKIVVL